MAQINTGAIARLLMPGLNTIFGGAYEALPKEYSMVFPKEMSDKNFEEDLNMHYFGMASVKNQGEALPYDVVGQGPTQYYTHVVYGLGYIITKEAITDNLYMQQAKEQTEALAFSMDITKETVAWNILNRAFNSSYTGFDGVSLCNSAHLLTAGGTYSNVPTTACDLSELAMEQAIYSIQGFTNDRGLLIKANEDTLIIPRQLQHEAIRILGGDERYNTANRDINAMKRKGQFPGGIVMSHYLTNSKSWFIQTTVPKGLRHFQRWELELENDTDFDTKNMQFSATERYSFGWTDPRGIWGSAGV
ncbi:hypothetical protein UFOVP1_56 [uncultured Caudovirales phage]|uniref:Bacteriophage Mu, GpT n=1 Tax=uncultured Caudovirales phage TaxID=2100421 RepID=A0A6J5KHU4_9CAUD|nr:hypothetical protein UFOVP1_56 [uncultured Caudovirales phage]